MLIKKGTTMSTPSNTDLKDAVTAIDSLAQCGFSRIASIAKIAIFALESPQQNLQTPENIRNTLSVIADMADDIGNCINAEAETVGCNYKGYVGVNHWTPDGVLVRHPHAAFAGG